MKAAFVLVLQGLLTGFPLALGDLVSSTNDLELILGHSAQISITATAPLPKPVTLNYTSNNDKVVGISVEGGGTGPPWKVNLKGEALGHDIISFNTTPYVTDVSKAFVRVTVMRSSELAVMSTVVGWIYFVAWSVSFYPQLYENWRRKSVVGLNFDFVFLNLIGFSLYSVFNCGLYWIPSVEAEYFAEHEKGLNPVQLNDVFFSLHATLITSITVIQCLIFERGGQTVSLIARLIIASFFIILLASLCFTLFSTYLTWLKFLSICSYLKLVTTLIKYVPQAFMNYKRKSTVGWSIGNVVLDFTGGILSTLQMIINADNYDDWSSIFGDPTKFGLGLFSVLFDIFFLIQHYILYKVTGYEELPGENVQGQQPLNSGYDVLENESPAGSSPSYQDQNQFESTTTEAITSNAKISSDTSLESPFSESTDPANSTKGTFDQSDNTFISC